VVIGAICYEGGGCWVLSAETVCAGSRLHGYKRGKQCAVRAVIALPTQHSTAQRGRDDTVTAQDKHARVICIREPEHPLIHEGGQYRYIGTMYGEEGQPVVTAWGVSWEDVLGHLLGEE